MNNPPNNKPPGGGTCVCAFEMSELLPPLWSISALFGANL